MTPEEKREGIAFHFGKILEILNVNLPKTPERIASLYVDTIFTGLDPATFPTITLYPESRDEEPILIKNVPLMSFCEHHFLPMRGVAHIAYIPKKGIAGLSRIYNLLQHVAKRPQLQERLTREITEALVDALQTESVAVLIQLKHHCLLAQEMEGEQTEMETVVWKGEFQSSCALRTEFLSRIKK